MKSIHAEEWTRVSPQRDPYYLASEEHAFLLWCEGLSIKEISLRVRGHAPMKILRFAHRLNRVLRKATVKVQRCDQS